MRKAMALVLLAVLLIGSIPMQAQAAYENTYQNTGNQRADIVGVALTQVGYQEGKGTGSYNNDTKYGDWAGHPKTEWCGWFVSWCARQANIPTSVLQTNGRASPSGFGLSSYYSSSQYTPRPGDLFFKKNFGHVGIVYYVEGSYFYTLEGNTSTSGWEGHSVMIRRRALNEFYFASPAYSSDSGEGAPPAHTHSYTTGYDNSHPHKEYKKCACGDSYYTGNTRTDSNCNTCNQSACSHSYGSWSSAGSSNHQKTCSKCGYRQVQSHQWVDGEITKEATCKESGKMSQTCSVCSTSRTKTLEKLDEHIYKDWIVADSDNHKRVCEYCDDEQTAPHVMMVDAQGEPVWIKSDDGHWHQCADCGKKLQSEEHVLKMTQDEQGHWQYCEVCDRLMPQQTHRYDHGCDNTCDDCGYIRQTEHVYSEVYSKDEQDHWFVCINCDQIKDQTAHQYQMVTWEDRTEVETCTDCGHTSGKVIVKSDLELLVEDATALLAKLGRAVIRQPVEEKWYPITGGGLCVAALAVVITVICLIVHGVRKAKKKRATKKA